MQQMQSINIDKWRKLNEKLFLSYVDCYTNLENNTINKEDAMLSALKKYDILLKADKTAYTAYYTIAREIGIFYQDEEDNYMTSDLTKDVINGSLTYSDYLKSYVLNTEFLINNQLVHPFAVIITEINKGNNTLDALVNNSPSLITEKNDATKDCLRIFIERAVDAGLISKNKKIYELVYSYQTLLDSCTYSRLSSTEFNDKFIGNQNIKQENIVKEMIERPIDLSIFNDVTNNQEQVSQDIPMKYPLNQILYGPPGTGKTYTTIKKALEILGLETGDPTENAEIFRSQLNHRIFFVTMHPSYSYEDFVQGMKPETNEIGQLVFKQKDGIFKKVADLAKNLVLDDGEETNTNSLSNIEILKIAFFLSKFNEKPTHLANKYLGNNSNSVVFADLSKKINVNPNTLKNLRDKFDYLCSKSRKGWTPRNSNEKLDNTPLWPLQDVYEELKEKTFEEMKVIVDSLLNSSNKEVQSVNKLNNDHFILIIDEINRANISKVFGELITLIEDDKRIGGENEMSLILSSGEEFSVPSNLYIIGTMNTADKSIALVDLALRRRFEFEAMYPASDIILELGKKECDEKKAFLDAINEQLIDVKGVDFQIGHAYFLKDNTLNEVINKNILPLLVEYFRNDLKKVESFMNQIGYPIIYTNGLLTYVDKGN
jgi:5-methylcytosine-specific restriction enzyme B